jgi:hypothetical protein
VFYMDITKVDRDVASVSESCCKCFRGMLQEFVQNILSEHFLSGCCTCFTHMLQAYIRNVSAVSVLC